MWRAILARDCHMAQGEEGHEKCERYTCFLHLQLAHFLIWPKVKISQEELNRSAVVNPN